jgi:indole-3-glycerol phosphate synthase
MSNILETIAARTTERVAEDKLQIAPVVMMEKALSMPKGDFPFEKALQKPGISFICECKKASPSKGIIAPDFDCLQTAIEYENAGADCLSILTEPYWFLGSDSFLENTKKQVKIPALRKDFTIDPYMIYQAKVLGADAILLIVSLLSKEQIKEWIEICDTLGLSALVEAHDAKEIETAIAAGARIIGVNNRNLKDFSVNIANAANLRDSVPENILFVAESGIQNRADIEALEKAGVNAVLIGETLMRADDKKAMLDSLKGLA